MIQALSQPLSITWETLAFRAIEFSLRPLQLLTSKPVALFFLALTAMLLRHPDVQFYEIDRIAFALLIVGVGGRALITRRRFFSARITWPMAVLSLLAVASVVQQPFEQETWSLLASKLLVPFALFHFSAMVFTDEARYRQFEVFALLVLAYLSFTAIVFLVGAKSLIFPRFILDESLGFHADRARGPLLQAVANGVSLNMLGLLAFHAYRRGRFGNKAVLFLLISLPVAILATMTRAVWLTFAGTAIVLVLGSKDRSWRLWGCVAAVVVMAAGLAFVMASPELSRSLMDRVEERGPVDFRKAVYAGGWEMFWQRPWCGWGFHRMPAELPRFVSGYEEKILYPHNTYLELLVEQGVVGFAVYLWLMWELWRLGRGRPGGRERDGFLGVGFHRIWPLLLTVYWVNAALVVMSYQFVNGLLFTLAGMLAGQRQREQAEVTPC